MSLPGCGNRGALPINTESHCLPMGIPRASLITPAETWSIYEADNTDRQVYLGSQFQCPP